LKREKEKYHYTNTTALSALPALPALRNLRSGTSPPQIMSHCEAPSPAPAPVLVFAVTQSPASPPVTEKILREMLVVKIRAAAKAAKKAEDKLGKLLAQLEILDSMSSSEVAKVKKVAKKHGLPHGGKIDAAGSFWADKNNCITCVGGGVRKRFVGVPIGEMCPNARLIEEDPKTGVKLLICQCQVTSE
jgi:hypothetical protein